MVWNRPFKAQLAAEYTNWMATAAQNAGLDNAVRTPSFDTVCGWILAAWKSVSKEIILRSFHCCGLTTAIDGSEDDQLHCFRIPDLSDGLRRLTEARAVPVVPLAYNNEENVQAPIEPVDALTDDEERDDDVLVDDMHDMAIGAEEEL